MPHSYDFNKTFSLEYNHRVEQSITAENVTLSRAAAPVLVLGGGPRDPDRDAVDSTLASQGHIMSRSFKANIN